MSGFSIDGFSDWFKNKDQESSFEIQKTKKYELIGMEATSKISSRKLAEKMNALDGNCDQLALEFVESGGTITKIKGKEIVIEVDSGVFLIKKMYIEIKDC